MHCRCRVEGGSGNPSSSMRLVYAYCLVLSHNHCSIIRSMVSVYIFFFFNFRRNSHPNTETKLQNVSLSNRFKFSLRLLVQVKRASRDCLLNRAFNVWGYSFAWLPTFHGYRALNEKVKGVSWFLGRFHARCVVFLAHWIHILCRRGISLCTLDFYLVAVLTRVERII